MKLGVVGLPNVGKSTLFNAITNAGALSANYPFCTIEPNVGIVAVPDERLAVLAKLYNSKKITPSTLEFVDIAGLVKGASQGEGLGNKFLSHIREVDAIVQVVRCFEDENITHIDGSINPLRDIETINLELIFADIESIEKRIAKATTASKSGEKKYIEEISFLNSILTHLENGKPVRTMALSQSDKELIKSYFLLTSKPVIYATNVSENDTSGNIFTNMVTDFALSENSEVVIISAKIEEELASIPEEERALFLNELGIIESSLNKLVTACYRLLGLISYLTAGEKEVRAWTIEKGTKAPQAAGKIHTDFEKGFIRAEVVDYKTLVELGSFNNAKEKGKVKSEGKDYIMQEDDVVLFRFNV